MTSALLRGAAVLAFVHTAAFAQTARYIPFEEARPLLAAGGPAVTASTWLAWAKHRDEEIRARLARGDEDSIVNLLLYGVSFTREARLTEREVALDLGPHQDVVAHRMDDLIRGAGQPSANERLAFVRDVLAGQGADVASAMGRRNAQTLLTRMLTRYVGDIRSFVAASERHEGLATLFSERGLSSDTSIYPGFAVDRALGALKAAGLMPAVQRVAVIGPGLDFADKREGLDAYPLQSIQPFAIVDSLLRLQLSSVAALHLTTFDLSPRVNHHLQSAVTWARQGRGYRLELPRSTAITWNPELVTYWERFGDQIGSPAARTEVPTLTGQVVSRAVSVRPEVVIGLTPRDLNIVLEQPDLASPGGPFDLIVATNTLIYYDQFEQSLAFANMARMLRPGGWLFVNDASPASPSIPLTPIGWTDLTYSDQVNSHDRLTWYQRR